MYCKVQTAIVHGVESVGVCVEADISQGLPCVDLVGFLGSEVKEARERVRTALKNVGYTLPVSRITVNLSPASLRKSGTGFDLPIAAAILGAMEQVDGAALGEVAMIGELSLTGEILPVNGILPMCLYLRGVVRTVVVPKANAAEARLVPDLTVIAVETLTEVISFLRSGVCPNGSEEVSAQEESLKYSGRTRSSDYDFSMINGQKFLRRACEIAVAGMHNFLMVGPPGAGKSMVAKCIPSILPTMTTEEQMEVSKIYSVCGLLGDANGGSGLMRNRPFRAPHHTISSAGMTGGGSIPHPGEITLAHRGVLFLDELPEFQRSTIEILRQPLEEHTICISRASGTFTFPADFILVAAMNPCNCGYFPDPNKCHCDRSQIQKYLGKISQPLLDRIDITVEAKPVSFEDLAGKKRDNESSAAIRARVENVQKLQQKRYENEPFRFNGQIPAGEMETYCPLGDKETRLLNELFVKLNLTARTYHKTIRVARTIADLAGEESITTAHLMEAVAFRSIDKKSWEENL